MERLPATVTHARSSYATEHSHISARHLGTVDLRCRHAAPCGLQWHEAPFAASVAACGHARTPSADARPSLGLLLTPMPRLQQALLFRHGLQDLPPRGDPWDNKPGQDILSTGAE